MLWCEKEFRDAEANKPFFDRGEALNLDNTDTTGDKPREAWQKLYEKHHLEELRWEGETDWLFSSGLLTTQRQKCKMYLVVTF